MARRITTKLRQMGTASRHYIYLESGLVKDSAFPFRPGEKVSVEIRGPTLIIRKAKRGDAA